MNKIFLATMTPDNPIPAWGNLFVYCFLMGWIIRSFVLPYEVSKRANRKFKYNLVSPEERQTFSEKEKRYLLLINVLGACGILVFAATAIVSIYRIFSENGVAG